MVILEQSEHLELVRYFTIYINWFLLFCLIWLKGPIPDYL